MLKGIFEIPPVVTRPLGTAAVQFGIQTVARQANLKPIMCAGKGTVANMSMYAGVGALIDTLATPYKPDILQGDVQSALLGALAGEMFEYIMDGGVIDGTFFQLLQKSPQCLLTAAAADYIAVNYVVPMLVQKF